MADLSTTNPLLHPMRHINRFANGTGARKTFLPLRMLGGRRYDLCKPIHASPASLVSFFIVCAV